MSMRKLNGVIQVQHDIIRQPPLMKSALLFPPQTKMSKFANPEFLRCRVAVIFSSGGSTFFLARQCFGAFMDALIGCRFCKNFYSFSLFLLPVLSPNHLHLFCILPCIKVVGKRQKMRGWSKKGVDLGVKMPEKRQKPIFRICADNGQKGVRNWCFGRRNGQNGRRKGVFRANLEYTA